MKVTMELPQDNNKVGVVYVNDMPILNVNRVENVNIVDWFVSPEYDKEEIKKTWCYCDGVRLLDYNGQIALRILPKGYIDFIENRGDTIFNDLY